jgi:hypothetical protein
LLCLELWFRAFMDGERLSPHAVAELIPAHARNNGGGG